MADHAKETTGKDRIHKGHYLTLLAAFLGWMFDGFEMGLFPIVARPALLDMASASAIENPEAFVGWWMGIITALFLIGAALGGWILGWLGDKIGRVRALSLSILLYSLFTGMGYFAQEPWHLGLFRVIASIGMGGEWSLGVALVMECWPERFRPYMAGIIGAAANFGFLSIGIIAFTIPVTPDSWRWMWLVGVAPALLVFFITLFVPESTRWKESVGKGGHTTPLREVFARVRLRTTIIGIILTSVALIGTWGSVQWIPVWVDQLVGPSMPHAKAMVGIWSGLGAIVGCIGGSVLWRNAGRRVSYFTLCLVSLAACSLLYRGGFAYGTTFQILVFLAGMTTAAFYGWFPLFLPELYPTRMRATGQGVCFNTGRVFAAAGSLMSGQLVAFFDGDYAKTGALITLVYVLGMACVWLAPETRGKPLPE
ncbi:MAG: MFS transporter [Candidatus Hydrogenedentes bacterium]|nr:MFS transporter [Candidatus Hydrogenedentota bacterium]